MNKTKLVVYNVTPIKCYGSISIPCKYNSDWHNIVDVQGPAVLGLPSLEQLKLLTLHCTIKKANKPARHATNPHQNKNKHN